jgi:hypothetical protein
MNVQGSQIFLKEDVRAALAAIWATNEAAMRYTDTSELYRAGFVACMLAVAIAFDVQREIEGVYRELAR